MLVLLTHANHLHSDAKQAEKMQPYPPLQTLIAAAVLRDAGFRVEFLDVTFECDVEAALRSHRPDVVAVCEDNFNFLTKMCLTTNRRLALDVARAARASGARAVVNSSDASDHAEIYLRGGFNTVILGELEAALIDVCDGRKDVAGTAFVCSSSRIHFGAPRRPIQDLDSLPGPAWDLLDVEPYRESWTKAHGHFAMNLCASRGCPYRCNWCAKPLYGSTYRHFSAERTALEIKRVKDTFHPDRLWFADDIFGLSNRWTIDFAKAVRLLDARVPFKMQSRCDLMTRDTVAALADAGCYEVWMGVESGSQQILDAMEKDIEIADVRAARANLKRHGIRACYFLQFGYAGEAWEDVQATIDLVRETQPDDIGVSVSYPLPNTKFHQIVAAKMGAKTNWSESGDLAVMYSGAFSREMYRALAEALHLEVRSPERDDAIRAAWEEVDTHRCVYC